MSPTPERVADPVPCRVAYVRTMDYPRLRLATPALLTRYELNRLRKRIYVNKSYETYPCTTDSRGKFAHGRLMTYEHDEQNTPAV